MSGEQCLDRVFRAAQQCTDDHLPDMWEVRGAWHLAKQCRCYTGSPSLIKTEDEIAFGKHAWVYCRQHCRPHQTGWCGVGPQDKVGLGVDNAQAAVAKCREWGFELYADREKP